jgi:hypothetical protein
MAIQFINAHYQFSLYPNLLTVDSPEAILDVNQLYEAIRHGYVKTIIEKLRSSIPMEEYSSIKRSQLPCVTLSGTFGQRRSSGLINHSGLIQIDLDQVENYDSIFKAIIQDPYTYLCFRSPGGNGIKVIVKINPSLETHLEQFYALEKYYLNNFGLNIDPACKDIARCMLLSYDPDIYCNPYSQVFEECYLPPPRKVVPSKRENIESISSSVFESIDTESYTIEALTQAIEQQRIDITAAYEDWIRIGYALCSSLGEQGRSYFHRIGRYYKGYTREESDSKYSKLLGGKNDRVGIGTLFFLAKEAGIEISWKNTPGLKAGDCIPEPEKAGLHSGEKLFDALKERRRKLASKEKLPPYVIFKDSSLIDMVNKSPVSLEEFLQIEGVSYAKAEKYAKDFLPLIRQHAGAEGPLLLVFDEKYKLAKDVLFELNDAEKAMYSELKKLRLSIAKEENKRAFQVFTDKTLMDLVKLKPRNEQALIGISGISQKRADSFGRDILDIIEQYS